jgi:RNA polymerase sigma-70 factor (ECF subfamily)
MDRDNPMQDKYEGQMVSWARRSAATTNEDALVSLALADRHPGLSVLELNDALAEAGIDVDGIDTALRKRLIQLNRGRVYSTETGSGVLAELEIEDVQSAVDEPTVQKGEVRSEFERTWRDHYRSFFRLALAHVGDVEEAEDCVQLATVKALRSLAAFRGESNMRTWLGSIVRNTALDHLKSAARRRSVAWEEWINAPDVRESVRAVTSDPEAELENRETAALVSRGIGEIENERLRLVLEWRYLEGQSYEEIARALGSSTGAARNLVYRAKKAFAEAPTVSELLHATM